MWKKIIKKLGVGHNGGGIGQGDHFLPHKFIKRTFERWVNPTKQLLNASRGHQATRKAAHCLQKEMEKSCSVQSLSCVWLFVTPWIAAHQASLSITNFWSSLKLTSIESVMPSSHLISVVPFSSCPQSLPASESFPMSQLFSWGGQSIGVSALASFLPKKFQGWSSEWIGWISL